MACGQRLGSLREGPCQSGGDEDAPGALPVLCQHVDLGQYTGCSAIGVRYGGGMSCPRVPLLDRCPSIERVDALVELRQAFRTLSGDLVVYPTTADNYFAPKTR